MYDEPLEEVYFNWLYHKVASVLVPTPSLSFYTVLRDLHATEFVWLLSGDDNRAQDGLDVRSQFLREAYLPHDSHWMSIGCSVLEMMIAFAIKAEFETDMTMREWFWLFMENLDLSDLNDTHADVTAKVTKTMDAFVWRTYRRNGRGGMFPLKNPQHDQTKVEIWYQFCEYLIENDIL
jgi:hypothetical protein